MEKQQTIKQLLEEILNFMNANAVVDIEVDAENNHKATIEGENLSFLIGYRGESIDALQTLLNITIFKRFGDDTKVLVDINGYRKQRQDKLEQIARNFIDRVRFLGKEVEMPPMNPFERKTVHTFVSTYDDVVSESTGEGHERRVVLKPKKS